MPEPARGSDADWAAYVFLEDNRKGVVREWWCHAPTNYWFIGERDTATDTMLRTFDRRGAVPGAQSLRMSGSPPARAVGHPAPPRPPARLPLRGPQLRGLRGRHAGLGAARQRRRRAVALVQVSPPARPADHARAGRQLLRPGRRRAQRPGGSSCRSPRAWSPPARTIAAASSDDRDAWIGRVARFLPVGFYYKAFYRPKGSWRYWERYIRAKAGLGVCPAARRTATSTRITCSATWP